ncbi:hypothetical protein F2Q69_00013916 [Brassica cretica]|uniref:Homeobox domain-containing protein n=1 Tax=Brassica cretica TaxID=69181 RepID=A0A8S9RA11_BRACR|nr:hypothetical protein F2Q69_00013916 [Brassica cretica]
MVEKYSTEKAKKKSAKAAKSRKSAPVGKKMHKHGAGLRCFLSIEWLMKVWMNHLHTQPLRGRLTRGKDGSFLDERTEELVLEVEEAVEQMLQDGSPLGDSQTDSTAASNAKWYLLNQEYIKRNLDVDMHMSGFETTISEVKEDIAGVKEDFSALKAEINVFKTEVTGGCQLAKQLSTLFCKLSNLKLPLLPQLHNHFSLKLSHNLKPQAQSQPQGQPQAPVQSQHQPQPQVQSTAPPQHVTTNNQSDIDRWCQELGYGETAVDRNNNGSSEEEVDMNNEFIDPQAEDRELKGQLLRKYSGYLGSLKQEFMKKRKKGKLPKEARQQLLDWWSRHYKWPYPPEQQKLALAESTGLDQKQINNWFINQRKRHWKPSEDMQFVVMDATHPHHYFMDNVLGNPFPTDHITSTML